MRCPECDQRNSVASSKCKFCGTKIRQKQTLGNKLLVGGGALVLAGALALSFLLPKLADPAESLTSCAKRVAAGPKSPEDAKRIKTDLDGALKAFLERFGDDNSAKLAARLQKTLPSTAFEVHVVDLPRGLKLVEIDTLLQASDFLVMKGTTETKVFPLPDFEVFDDARAVNDQAGPVLVLVGHSSGQLPHKPRVKTYALLPDFIVDETEKMVPMLKGEGTAKFVGSGADVQVDLSVASMAREEKVTFSSPLSDISIRQRLRWKDAKYWPEYDIGSDANAYLFMLGRCLAKPDMAVLTLPVIGPEAARMIKERAGDGLGDVSITAFSGRKNAAPSFSLRGKGKEFLVSLVQDSKKWQVSKFAVSEAKAPAANASATAEAPKSTVPSGPSGEVSATAAPVVAPEYVTAMAPPTVAPSVVTAASGVPSVAPSVVRAGGESAPVAVESKQEKDARAPEPKKREQEQRRKDEEQQQRSREDERRRKEQEAKSPPGTQSAIIANYLSSPSVRLRSKPSLNGNTLTEIPRGAKLSVSGKESGWYKVSYNGQTGYVYGGLVDFKKPASVAHAPASSAYTTAIVTKSMTVRDERRRAMAHPQPGDRLVIVSGINRNNKYKVQLSDGRIGYLDKSAVDVKVETPEFVP
ncbi:MAG: SH3 domain-containing protein [Candidatus Obscuribacterales bacterium]|nr:SH3 domain-containing protein [Candidatus Obscuribacterales bacterium]